MSPSLGLLTLSLFLFFFVNGEFMTIENLQWENGVPPPHAGRNRRSPGQPPAKEKVSSPAAEKLACSRRDMHINPRQLLGDSIIQPNTFNAYDCRGKCESPFNDGQGRFKTHAYLKYLNYLARNNSKPVEYCCVPSAYKSLHIVYYNKKTRNFVMRDFPDMIVTECNCVLKNTFKTG